VTAGLKGTPLPVNDLKLSVNVLSILGHGGGGLDSLVLHG
jgi:hypothetical protein